MPNLFKKIGRKINRTAKTVAKNTEKSFNTVANDIADGTNKAITKVEDTTINIRNIINDKDKMPPQVERFIKRHGKETIASVSICRTPVPAAITGALKAITNVPYDKLFHLFLLITTSSGTKFIFEKNERILITKTIPKSIEKQLPISELNGKIFENVFYTTRSSMGDKFLPYNASSNNCQNFILSVLHANGVNKAKYNTFIKQDTGKIFKDKPGVRKLANSVVKLGKVSNMLVSGGTVKKNNPWLAHVKEFRSKHPEMKYSEVLKQAKDSYKK